MCYLTHEKSRMLGCWEIKVVIFTSTVWYSSTIWFNTKKLEQIYLKPKLVAYNIDQKKNLEYKLPFLQANNFNK